MASNDDDGPPRGFPFRLFFWAMLMTAAAGVGGYYTWKFHAEAQTSGSSAKACIDGRDLALKQASDESAKSCRTQIDAAAAACDTKVTDLTAHSKEADAELTKMSENLHATKDELDELRIQKVESEKRVAAMETLRTKFDDMTHAGDLKVTSRRGVLIVELPSDLLFERAKTSLVRKGEVAVLQVAGILKQLTDRRFLVVVHTDGQSVKGTAFKDNLELSMARALVVSRSLLEGGMDSKNLVTAGAGESDPIGENATPAGQARNRRVEIQLLPAVSELPPLPPSIQQKPAPK